MPSLNGHRVVLRSLDVDDIESMVAGRTSLVVQGSLPDYPDREQLRTRISRWNELRDGRVNLGIEVERRLIGEIQTFRPAGCPVDSGGRVCEVGLSIYDVEDRGRGLGVEAMRLFVEWLLKQGVELIVGSTASVNQPMRKVFERVGFTLAAGERGSTHDALRYQLRRADSQPG